MGKASSPDYGDIAASQGEDNREVVRDQIYANRPDQYTPWGANTWDSESYIDPTTGKETTKWNQTTSLSPELQELFNKQMAIQGGRTDVAGMLTDRMGGEFGAPVNWEGLSPMGQVPNSQFTLPEGQIDDPYQTRQRAEDAMYSQAQSRLQPKFQAARDQAEVKMRNQGLGPEDSAWKSQMQALGRDETDANNQAMWSSVGEGRNEAGQMYNQQMGRNQNTFNQALNANNQNYGQAMQGANFANQNRQQQMAETLQKRGSSLNEINALLNGGQVGMPSMPNFNTASAAAPAPTYQAGVDQGNFDQASSPWSGISSLAGTLGGAYLGRTPAPAATG
jgi:hypothetical protein